MSDALLLLPDFLLIVVGFLMCRYTALDRPVWDAAERLVYTLLFPVLLFTAIVRSPLHPAPRCRWGWRLWPWWAPALRWPTALRRLARRGPAAACLGRADGLPLQLLCGAGAGRAHGGTQGLAWIALLVALCVPLCNVAAVWPLARHGGQGTLRELLRNPLILATVAGLVANLAGLRCPTCGGHALLGRIGSAALPLGLMAVGAGLRAGRLQKAPGWPRPCWHPPPAVLPLSAMGLVLALGTASRRRAVLVAFAALPTASSCYVLAVRMGGDGPYVAGLVTVSTLLGMAGLPLRWQPCSRLLRCAERRRRAGPAPNRCVRAPAGRRPSRGAAAAPGRSGAASLSRQRIAQRHRQVALPACMADAADRAALGAAQELASSHCHSCSSVALVPAARARRSRAAGALRKLVPGAGQLAVVTAVDAVAHQRCAARAGSARRARWSGTRCSAAHPACSGATMACVGHRSMQALQRRSGP
jgi:malonate transporter